MVNPNAIDISNWSGTITPAHVASWRAQGISLVVIGAQVQSIAIQQANTVLAGGLDWHIYQYLAYSGDVSTQVAQALALGAQFPKDVPAIIWLDAEDETGNLSSAQRIAQHAKARAMVANTGYQPGTYTGKYYWQDYMANTTQFSADPLWFASYWNDGHIQQVVDFGGWTKAMIHQFKGTTSVDGVSADLDYDFLMTDPHQVTPPEADMTADEVQALIDKAITAYHVKLPGYLDLAVNGGPGQFADSNGNPVPLVEDKALTNRVTALENTSKAYTSATVSALTDIATILKKVNA